MEAVIVAAGRGTRLGAVGRHAPKCLLRIAGHSLLDYQLRALAGAGIRRATVVVGYLAERIAAHLAGLDPSGLTVRLVENQHYLTTGGGASFLCGAADLNDDVLYLIGDMFCHPELVRRLAGQSAFTLGIQIRPTLPEEMKVRLAGDRIAEIGKRIAPDRAHGEFTGAAFVPRTLLPLLCATIRRAAADPAKQAFHFGDMVREMLAAGMPVGWADLTDVPWCEIDFVHDLRRARECWQEWDSFVPAVGRGPRGGAP